MQERILRERKRRGRFNRFAIRENYMKNIRRLCLLEGKEILEREKKTRERYIQTVMLFTEHCVDNRARGTKKKKTHNFGY